jgi:intein/homing endonuclease
MLEKGFVFGASHDGIVYYREDKNEYGLEIDQKSEEWLKTVQKFLERAYKKKSRIRKTRRGYFRLNVYSKDIYSELQKFKGNPRLVLEQSKNFQTGFLQGIFDAEGSIRLERKHITISSNNPKTISVVAKLLKNLEIITGKPFKDKNNVISIPFYGKDNLLKFKRYVNFRHPEKRQRLEALLE